MPKSSNIGPTPWIDSTHPDIVAYARELTAGAATETEKAVRIHDAVRDRIRFGIPRPFYAMRASEVLQAGVGFCNTKATLLSALMRASGVPTRMKMVDLDSVVLRGLFDPGTTSVDHAIVEVYVDGRWIALDSYVVDRRLEAAARAKLAKEGGTAGYGIDVRGTVEWSGASDAFIQALPVTSAPKHVLSEWGYFEDVMDFYAQVPSARNRLTSVTRILIALGAVSINRRIEQARQGSWD